ARHRAAELANDSDLRLRAAKSFWGEIERHSESPNRDPRLPPAVTVLERIYRGQIIRVTVLANGFEYHGKHYASLSAIAHRVTGTSRSLASSTARWRARAQISFGLRLQVPGDPPKQMRSIKRGRCFSE